MNRWKMHATLESLSFPEIWFQISAIPTRLFHFSRQIRLIITHFFEMTLGEGSVQGSHRLLERHSNVATNDCYPHVVRLAYTGIAAEPEATDAVAENTAKLEVDRIGCIPGEASLRRADRSADVVLVVCEPYADIGP